MWKVVVVIPTHNRKEHLEQVLHDLRVQRVYSVEFKTVVVVDGSTDGTLEMLASRYPEVDVVEGDGDLWYTASMNRGFERAYAMHPHYVLTMNDDVRLPEDYVQNLVNAEVAQDGVCVMGSISVTHDAPHRITFSGVKDIKWWRYKYIPYLAHYTPVEADQLHGVKDSMVLPGRGMLIPARVLRDLGGFDPSLSQYGSDDDFCLRASKAGARVMVSYDAVVYSYDQLTGVGNPSRKDGLKKVLKAFRNRYSTLYLPKTAAMIRRHGVALLLPITLLITVLGSLRANMKTT